MDTRLNLLALIDYKEFYETDRNADEATELIRDIPSVTLINYISGFAVELYLNENSEQAENVQINLMNSLIIKAGQTTIEKCKEVFIRLHNNGHKPVIFYSHSNLLFYNLIFENFNTLPLRDLTNREAKNVFDAYLLINSYTTNKFNITEGEIKKAVENKTIEEFLLPNFIYQKDYASSTDFTNQIIRGEMFFKYLEESSKFSSYVNAYYKSLNVSGYINIFKNLLMLFSELKIENKTKTRTQLANFENYEFAVNFEYLEILCVNNVFPNYSSDLSFSILRNKMLFKLDTYRFFILNINFLIDQFYKAQVFGFNSFLKANNVKGEFLSTKAKEFTEDIYLRKVMNDAFAKYYRFSGNQAKGDKGELTDFYLREGSRIALCEFKDVLLNASSKNSTDRGILFAELDKKFFENQTKAPKGIRQLNNAISYIESKSVPFDPSLPTGKLEIFPILIYTDLSFGADGINKKYNKKFLEEIEGKIFSNLIIHNIVFINLNFFEVHIDYFKNGVLNLFDMLSEYFLHTASSEYDLTPFEVFSRFYLNTNKIPELKISTESNQLFSRIMTS